MIDDGAKKIGFYPEDSRVKCSDSHFRKGNSGGTKKS